MDKIICPVPLSQRPLNEYNNIRNSWIISWPFLKRDIFYMKLTFSWLFFIPICLTICYGSTYLKNNHFELIFISLTASLAFPILLLIRQWLSWVYIYKRLNSENIEYEESGWYDGQIWVKTPEILIKDKLAGQYQVKPILDKIKQTLFAFSFLIFVALYFIQISNEI